MKYKFLKQAGLFLLLSPLVVLLAYFGKDVYSFSKMRGEIKKDYSQANNITYGLLSVNAWKDHLTNIVNNRIEDFEFTRPQQDSLKYEINGILNAMITKADSLVNKKQKTVRGKLTKFAVNTFINIDKVRLLVPQFSQTILDEVNKPQNKSKLKYVASSKLGELADMTYDSTGLGDQVCIIYEKYNAKDAEEFNAITTHKLKELMDNSYQKATYMIGILLLILLIWFAIRNFKVLHAPFFIVSVFAALVVLAVGLTAPMIEIDARIKQLNFSLIGETINFNDQVIFFQSKSIIDVVHILITTGKIDSMAVGVLLLIFSILFPIVKLLSTQAYLIGSEKIRYNKIIYFFAFKSGKWSMADVMVVAIFMAYIGFNGILDTQLKTLNIKAESVNSIATNETTLQPGFILFVCFVLYSLMLSVILKQIAKAEVKKGVREKM